jgi:hypothetical protein
VLQRDGIVDLIGADHVHGNVGRAVEAQLADGDRGHVASGKTVAPPSVE